MATTELPEEQNTAVHDDLFVHVLERTSPLE